MKIYIKRAVPSDEATVQSIFKQSPTYFKRVDGTKVESHFAKREMQDVPKSQSRSYEKVFCIVELDEQPIGVVDLHKDHPSKGTVYLGLLLLLDHLHGKGIGRAAYDAVEQFAIVELGARKIKLGISDQNQVDPFWIKMGFRPNGSQYKWMGEKNESVVTEMEKDLPE